MANHPLMHFKSSYLQHLTQHKSYVTGNNDKKRWCLFSTDTIFPLDTVNIQLHEFTEAESVAVEIQLYSPNWQYTLYRKRENT